MYDQLIPKLFKKIGADKFSPEQQQQLIDYIYDEISLRITNKFFNELSEQEQAYFDKLSDDDKQTFLSDRVSGYDNFANNEFVKISRALIDNLGGSNA